MALGLGFKKEKFDTWALGPQMLVWLNCLCLDPSPSPVSFSHPLPGAQLIVVGVKQNVYVVF
jgi:hypothetical protein